MSAALTVVDDTTASTPASTSGPNPDLIKFAHPVLRTLLRAYHRADSSGVENVPDGGALLVSNHSGGTLAIDVPLIATAIWEQFGRDRDVRVLAHDMLMKGPIGKLFGQFGFLAAHPDAASSALADGAATIVFPGGDWDACRPLSKANVIDFGGRVGYVRTALAADVPIVPIVSVGGHEAQLILTRGEWLGRRTPLRNKMRSSIAPVTVGVPFGVSVGIAQFPLPSKISTRFLEPIHLRDEFGPDPDPREVDAVVRARMRAAVDELAGRRRFPVFG
jgi:1-acyl-sn-glycerol-3-phosphate acyltransferase